VNRRCQG